MAEAAAKTAERPPARPAGRGAGRPEPLATARGASPAAEAPAPPAPQKKPRRISLAFTGAVLLMLLLALAITAWAGAKTGWFDLRQQLSQLPGISRLLPAAAPAPGEAVAANARLERENLRLAQEIKALQEQLQQELAEKQAQREYLEALEQKVALLEGTPRQQQSAGGSQVDYKQLAAYYAEMKPESAKAIMEHLEDEMVLGILRQMENEQAAKILAALPAERAARLSAGVTQQP